MSKEEQLETYEKIAKKIKPLNEKKVFLKELRKKLLSKAEGKVLEVAVGRGANFHLYPKNIEITAVDFSPSLLELAKATALKNKMNVEFIISDAERLEMGKKSFDTIVSTLSLCAYDNPVMVLNKFVDLCKTDGQILLLEHGISSNKMYGGILNIFLDSIDRWNMKKMGCHSNRDILGIIRESNINIEEIKTCLFGTHYIIVGRPKG